MSASAVADTAVGEPADHPSGPPPDAGLGSARILSPLLALGSGLVLMLAFPGALDWWPLAPVAVGGLALAARGRTARAGAGLGYLFGLAFFVPHLHWSGIYVGLLPWFALAAASAAFMAGLGAVLPRIWRVPFGPAGTALAGAGLWVAQEALRDRVPFGGFPWGRLAFSQSGAPDAGLAALGGAPLVTAATAATGTLLAWALVRLLGAARLPRIGAGPARPRGAGLVPALRRVRPVLPALLALAVAALVATAGSAVPLPTGGTAVRVAAVQGNVPEAGLEFNAERRAVLDNHVKATLALAARIRAGTSAQPDLVLWPENSSDIDPLRNDDAARVIARAVAAVGVPVLVGAVLEEPPGKLSNAGIVWGPDGGPDPGPGARYVKRHPAPFAEYIPDRSFFRHISDKVDLVPRDFVSGDRLRANPVGVLAVGPAKVGDVICFEVAYDDLVRDPVRQGADILAVQTNNATFGYSDESVQQLAMSRLRAIEAGRTVVHVSTVGVSAIILPDGTIRQRSSLFRPDVLEATVPLRTSLTVATRVGEWPEGVLAAVGVLLLLAGVIRPRRRARSAEVVRSGGTLGSGGLELREQEA